VERNNAILFSWEAKFPAILPKWPMEALSMIMPTAHHALQGLASVTVPNAK